MTCKALCEYVYIYIYVTYLHKRSPVTCLITAIASHNVLCLASQRGYQGNGAPVLLGHPEIQSTVPTTKGHVSLIATDELSKVQYGMQQW